MCHKIRLFNFHFKVLIKYDNNKNSAKYHKIFMSLFWEIVFCEPLHFFAAMFVVQFKTRAVTLVPADSRQNCVWEGPRWDSVLQSHHPPVMPMVIFGISFPVQTLKIPHSDLQIRWGSRIPLNCPWLGTLKLSVWNPQIIYFDHSRKMSSWSLFDSIYKSILSFF